MSIVIIVLGILYLCGVKVGTALAICSIIESAGFILTELGLLYQIMEN